MRLKNEAPATRLLSRGQPFPMHEIGQLPTFPCPTCGAPGRIVTMHTMVALGPIYEEITLCCGAPWGGGLPCPQADWAVRFDPRDDAAAGAFMEAVATGRIGWFGAKKYSAPPDPKGTDDAESLSAPAEVRFPDQRRPSPRSHSDRANSRGVFCLPETLRGDSADSSGQVSSCQDLLPEKIDREPGEPS